MASLPKWSAKRLSTHQLSYASAGVYDIFPAWCLRCDSPVGSNPSLRATQSSRWTCSHSVSSAWRSYTEKGRLSWLKQHNFVIFQYISTKLGDKVYIWLFDSHVKFHAKICTHGRNINKSHRGGATFLCSPGIYAYCYISISNFATVTETWSFFATNFNIMQTCVADVLVDRPAVRRTTMFGALLRSPLAEVSTYLRT